MSTTTPTTPALKVRASQRGHAIFCAGLGYYTMETWATRMGATIGAYEYGIEADLSSDWTVGEDGRATRTRAYIVQMHDGRYTLQKRDEVRVDYVEVPVNPYGRNTQTARCAEWFVGRRVVEPLFEPHDWHLGTVAPLEGRLPMRAVNALGRWARLGSVIRVVAEDLA